MIGDTLDIEMFDASKWKFKDGCDNRQTFHPESIYKAIDAGERFNDGVYQLSVVHTFDFSADFKRMSVIAEVPFETDKYIVFVKGAPEIIKTL